MYNCERYTKPIWEDEIIYHESFMPIRERKVVLAYKIDEVISVMNAVGNEIYTEGKDYEVKDGKLIIPEGSAIKVMPYSDYNISEDNGFKCVNGGFLLFGEGSFFHRMQYEITYKHSDVWTGYVPCANPEKLPRTKSRLKNGEPFTLGFLGDSITVGANSSKLARISPNAPIWCEMIAERLTEVSGCEIEYINKAVGGTVSGWGNENVSELFKGTKPDLFVTAFGMNDATCKIPNETFIANIEAITEKVLKLNPECEFVFVSTTMPNPLAETFTGAHDSQEAILTELAGKYGSKADTARVTTIHKELLKKKRYHDMTGNNINHPNDFLARVYAQTVLEILK